MFDLELAFAFAVAVAVVFVFVALVRLEGSNQTVSVLVFTGPLCFIF
jgi:hypothetical protein